MQTPMINATDLLNLHNERGEEGMMEGNIRVMNPDGSTDLKPIKDVFMGIFLGIAGEDVVNKMLDDGYDRGVIERYISGSVETFMNKSRQGDSRKSVEWIYIISDGEKLKIGFSNDPTKRLSMLQCGNSNPLVIVDTFECPSNLKAADVEKRIHMKLADHRRIGEWFEINERIAKKVILLSFRECLK